jgi:thiol:disulfide interchange protein DsbD
MVEQSRSAAFGSALFFTLALGLGLPYVALALAAGSIRRLPRSGEWLRWVEQLFGFVLVGLALYFVEPLAPNRLIERLLPFYTAGAGIFLGFITSAGSSARPFKLVRAGVGTASLAVLAYLFLSLGAAPAELSFEPYNEALIKTAAAKHRPVVIDFSADWCIPCREMERTTFADPAVIREAARFVRLRANLTKDDHQNQTIIDHYDVQGVPTTVFIDSAGKIRKRTVGYIGPGEFLKELRELD